MQAGMGVCFTFMITIYKRMYENKQKTFLIQFFFLKNRNKQELTLCLCPGLTASVVYSTAKVTFTFISLSAVQNI